jgi:hypothetical protein
MTSDKPLPIDEAEWQAQEQALRSQDDRVLASALASHRVGEPPADFAASVVASVALHESATERRTIRLFLAAFAVVISVAVALYGASCWQALNALPGDHSRGWVVIGLACIVLSWVPRLLRPASDA